jgi:hypothetical protein
MRDSVCYVSSIVYYIVVKKAFMGSPVQTFGDKERGDTLEGSPKEISQRSFSTDCIAYQHSEKINGLIATEAPTHQTDLMGKGIQKT